jgi:hypothetical protein
VSGYREAADAENTRWVFLPDVAGAVQQVSGCGEREVPGEVPACVQACRHSVGLNNHGVVWHTATRASGATRMLRDYGIDVRTVQLIGGWSSLDQMAQYLGIDAGMAVAQSKSRKRQTA